MSVTLNFEMPESAFAAVHKGPKEFLADLRLAAAVKWFELGIVSGERAAEIAGVSRVEFINALSAFRVSPIQETADEVLQGLKNAD